MKQVFYEACIHCGELTERAGRDDDSLYDEDNGPYCSECFDDIIHTVEA